MPTPRAYHHGNLRQTLLNAAVQLAEEVGTEHLSLREVARRVGVAPSAPYRHFASRKALLTAVAEEATERLRIGMVTGVAAHRQHGLEQLQALGEAYLGWAEQHPMHFRVVSAREQIDYAVASGMAQRNQELRDMTVHAVQLAQQQGAAQNFDPQTLAVLARATVYGLARMQTDGHFAQWGLDSASGWQSAHKLLGVFIGLLGQATPEA
nr:TetR/AcrR family transcriptional regulator [uncultured Albidiferax sp.]